MIRGGATTIEPSWFVWWGLSDDMRKQRLEDQFASGRTRGIWSWDQ